VSAYNAAAYKPFTPFTPFEFGQLIGYYFEVPEHSGMYILGSFARHVTLYSQLGSC
jgi:hypothetical protein